MEPLDQTIADVLDETTPVAVNDNGPARILIVGGEDALRLAIAKTLRKRNHGCTCVASLDQARNTVSRSRFDVLVLHQELPDGDGLDLAPLLQKTSPSTKTIVVSARTSTDAAVHAMRCGAVDFISLPIDMDELGNRVDTALIKSRVDRQRDERLLRLKKICRELNVARHEISKQVDGLCEDLTNAYQEIAEQMTDVAMASEFRTLLKQELDVEELLRTTLEYVLTKTGPTNAAVFLPDCSKADGEQHFGLGAYVNYDCPRETISVLLDHLGQAICPQMADESDIISFTDAREFAQWIGSDAGILSDSHVVAFSCRHKKECLAVIVLFRDKSNQFDESLAGVIDTLREIIAEQLANVIRVHHRARPSWPKEAKDGDRDYQDDDLGFGYEGGMAA